MFGGQPDPQTRVHAVGRSPRSKPRAPTSRSRSRWVAAFPRLRGPDRPQHDHNRGSQKSEPAECHRVASCSSSRSTVHRRELSIFTENPSRFKKSLRRVGVRPQPLCKPFHVRKPGRRDEFICPDQRGYCSGRAIFVLHRAGSVTLKGMWPDESIEGKQRTQPRRKA